MGILALDDTDSSIQYSVGWNKAGSALEYNKTTSWTVVAGATAKISFRGTSIGVYGTISSKTKKSIAPRSAYSIDGGTLTGFTAIQADKAQYSQLFFQSPSLTDGAHVLTVTNALVADPLFLDFMLVSQTTDTPGTIISLPASSATLNSSTSLTSSTSSVSSTTTLSTSSSITSTAAPITVTVTSLAPSSTVGSADAAKASNSGDTVGSTKKSNAGAVVGGVLGTVAILLAFAFGFVYYNRKRQQRQRRNSLMDYQTSGSANYWNRPLATAVTPHSDRTSDPYAVAPTPSPPQPNMTQNNAGSTAYGQMQAQTRYPGGYTPGSDYYEPSDIAYNVNPAPSQGGGGYIPPSQLMSQNQGGAAAGSGYGYGYENDYNRAGSGAPYGSQGGYGYGNGARS